MTMTKELGELQPLVPPSSSSSSTYYNDNNYTPIDESSSEQILKRKRLWIKLGKSMVLLIAFVVVLSLWSGNNSSGPPDASLLASIQADHLFAGLLSDEQAFYFPTSLSLSSSLSSSSLSSSLTTEKTSPLSRRRSLRGDTTNATNEEDYDDDDDDTTIANTTKHDIVNWSYDWKQNNNANDNNNENSAAAIGEYYRYKGFALANYYQSKYNPTYKAPEDGAAADNNIDTTTIMDTWSDDWKADKGRGIALGEKYQAIGDAIDEHYRKAFTDNGKNNNNNSNKEYYWESDRDLGQTIGEHYKAIGKAIDEHYNSIKDDDGIDWDTKWMEYKKKGKEIGNYYKSKGDAIDEFYKGKYPLEGMVSPSETVSGAAVPQDTAHQDTTTTDTDTDSTAAAALAAAVSTEANDDNDTNNNDGYIWDLDWKKDRDHGIAIHSDWMKKGIAINEYYRAKYDPTINGISTATTNHTTAIKDDKDVVPLHNPDVDFPPWGTNHGEVDREHGIAIHEYWKKQHELMKEQYNKTTNDGVNYYEDFYRSKFDPTYKNYHNNGN